MDALSIYKSSKGIQETCRLEEGKKMRAHEVDSWSDYFQYWGEVYNPIGYISFALDEDRDWAEKAEHSAIVYTTIGVPFHIMAALSEGGWALNRPPGHMYRSVAMKKLVSEYFYKLVRRASVLRPSPATLGRLGVVAPVALLAVAATAGWIATADKHGAVTPGVASGIGMPLAPTTGGSVENPLGLTWGSFSESLGNLVPGFLS